VTVFLVMQNGAYLDPTILKPKTFGTAMKDGLLSTKEEIMFEYSCEGGGSITEMWWAGPGFDGFPFIRVRFYVDGETSASIDYQLYLAHGIGWGDDSLYRGHEYMGKNAYGGGIYHTFRIPFSSKIKVTAQLPYATSNTVWFIIRGVERLPVILGEYQLPNTTRLRLYKNENITVAPHQYVPLSHSKRAGAVFLVTVQAESDDLNYLEGCFRAYIDGSSKPTFLSSGTEDFFLSCSYYSGGEYFTTEAGLTHYDLKGPTRLSMYKFFHRDPLMFTKELNLVWRNFDDQYSCPRRFPEKHHRETEENVRIAPMTYTSYTWVYEW